MPGVPEELEYFDDPDLEEERRDRTPKLLYKIASLPSHNDWFDVEVFEEDVTQYVVCLITVRELDKLIINDPMTYGSLDRIRNNMIKRKENLAKTLGLTAAKINQLIPKKKEKAKGMAALAETDYTE
jgi:hypothetical protein